MTQTEREFQKVNETLTVLTQRLVANTNEIDSLWDKSEKSDTAFDKLRDQYFNLHSQVEVLKASFDDFKKRWDESERRRWTIAGVFLAATLTFVANLVMLVLRK